MSKKLGVEMAAVIVGNKKEFDKALTQEYESIFIRSVDNHYWEINYKQEDFDTKLIIESGKIILRGETEAEARKDCQIIALDKTEVSANDNSRVIAKNNSRIISYSTSTVIAYGSSYVLAKHNSKVIAHELSTVSANDGSKIIARVSSTVCARDKCHVTAFDAAFIERMSHDAKIEINDFSFETDYDF